MAKVFNESGDIKFLDEKGNVKWFSAAIADNAALMKQQGMTLFDSPEVLEPKIIKSEPSLEVKGLADKKLLTRTLPPCDKCHYEIIVTESLFAESVNNIQDNIFCPKCDTENGFFLVHETVDMDRLREAIREGYSKQKINKVAKPTKADKSGKTNKK